MSFLVSVYNYPILSLDKEFVNDYIELGIAEWVFISQRASPFGSMAMLRTTLRCIALEPWSLCLEVNARRYEEGPGVKHRVNYS
jgi:hypothetical protein